MMKRIMWKKQMIWILVKNTENTHDHTTKAIQGKQQQFDGSQIIHLKQRISILSVWFAEMYCFKVRSYYI